jgi:hypothetical protein
VRRAQKGWVRNALIPDLGKGITGSEYSCFLVSGERGGEEGSTRFFTMIHWFDTCLEKYDE